MGNGPSGKRHRQQAYAPASERQPLPSRQNSHRAQRAISEERVIEEDNYIDEDPVPHAKHILSEAAHHSPAPVQLPGQIHDDEPEMEAGLARDLQDVHFFAGAEDIVDWEALSGPACRGAIPMLVELESMQRCDRWLWRPLHYAAIYGSVDAIDLLVKAGATVDARTGGHARVGAQLTKASFNFAAHLECRFGNKNLAVNAVEVNGDMVTITPPHSKAMQIIPVTQCICAGYNTGQQPHHVARFGYATPLHVAVEFQHSRAIRALLSHRADPNTSWNEGSDRPLHTAVLQGSEETVSLLLRARADPNSEDAWGRVPLILGATCHQAPPRNIAQMLLDAGAHQAVTDKSGKTAAQLARESGHNDYADAVELYDINERADIKAKRMAEEKAKREAEESARILAEERALWEAQERAKREALEQARRAAEEEARRAAEEEARQRAEEARLRQLREEQARRDAEERARLEAEERARIKAEEERARQEAEESARREAEERARQEEERVRQEEERARQEAEEAERRARLDAEERARLDAEKKEAEEKARLEAEERARLEEEERARLEAEEKARQEELARLDAEERARLEAEEKARLDAEEKARLEAEEKTRQEAEEKARQEAEERSRLEAEERARQEESEKAEEQEKLGKWLTALALHTVVGTMNRRREAWHREFAKVRSDRWDRAIARPPLDSTTGRMIASSGRADLLRAGGLVKEATKLEKDLERKGQNLEKLRAKWKRMAELSDMSPEEATTIMVREFGYED